MHGGRFFGCHRCRGNRYELFLFEELYDLFHERIGLAAVFFDGADHAGGIVLFFHFDVVLVEIGFDILFVSAQFFGKFIGQDVIIECFGNFLRDFREFVRFRRFIQALFVRHFLGFELFDDLIRQRIRIRLCRQRGNHARDHGLGECDIIHFGKSFDDLARQRIGVDGRFGDGNLYFFRNRSGKRFGVHNRFGYGKIEFGYDGFGQRVGIDGHFGYGNLHLFRDGARQRVGVGLRLGTACGNRLGVFGKNSFHTLDDRLGESLIIHFGKSFQYFFGEQIVIDFGRRQNNLCGNVFRQLVGIEGQGGQIDLSRDALGQLVGIELHGRDVYLIGNIGGEVFEIHFQRRYFDALRQVIRQGVDIHFDGCFLQSCNDAFDDGIAVNGHFCRRGYGYGSNFIGNKRCEIVGIHGGDTVDDLVGDGFGDGIGIGVQRRFLQSRHNALRNGLCRNIRLGESGRHAVGNFLRDGAGESVLIEGRHVVDDLTSKVIVIDGRNVVGDLFGEDVIIEHFLSADRFNGDGFGLIVGLCSIFGARLAIFLQTGNDPVDDAIVIDDDFDRRQNGIVGLCAHFSERIGKRSNFFFQRRLRLFERVAHIIRGHIIDRKILLVQVGKFTFEIGEFFLETLKHGGILLGEKLHLSGHRVDPILQSRIISTGCPLHGLRRLYVFLLACHIRLPHKNKIYSILVYYCTTIFRKSK